MTADKCSIVMGDSDGLSLWQVTVSIDVEDEDDEELSEFEDEVYQPLTESFNVVLIGTAGIECVAEQVRTARTAILAKLGYAEHSQFEIVGISKNTDALFAVRPKPIKL